MTNYGIRFAKTAPLSLVWLINFNWMNKQFTRLESQHNKPPKETGLFAPVGHNTLKYTSCNTPVMNAQAAILLP